jgi:hypothetical protein
MLGLKKTAIAFDEKEMMKREKIILDGDKAEALTFLKGAVYNRIVKGQQNRLKSHLDIQGDPVEGFKDG